jgi:hypothetical protein
MYKTRRLSLISLFLLLAAGVAGQKEISSPYARYGIGNLAPQGTFRTLAMGGISSGIRNNLTLNYLTPASYSSIDTSSFIFDFGIDYSFTNLQEDDLTFYSQDINFSHLMLGFPLKKGWGFAAGIVPFSNGYYTITDKSVPEGSGTGSTDDILESHRGSGGYHKVYLGTAYNFLSFFSAGLNAFVIFGEITRYNDFIFTADNNYFNTRDKSTNSMDGIGYEASVQFMLPLQENRFFNAGLTYTPQYSLWTTNEELIIRYSNVQTSNFAFDTLHQAITDTISHFPRSIRGGLSFGKTDKLTFGADILYSYWSEASLPGNYGTYTNTLSLSAGAEYIPDKYSNYSFFDRMEYRIGGHYDESYALYNDKKVREYGITFGTGIPLRKSRSRISLYVDLSTRGNPDDNLPKEGTISVGVSLNLYDYWFLKAKYD